MARKENDVTDVVSKLAAGQRIFVAGSVNEPTALLETLKGASLPERLHFLQFPLGGYNQVDFTALSPSSQHTTFFMTRHLRDCDPERLHFLPMQMRAVYDYLADSVDVVMVQVARDTAGRLRLGPNVDFLGAALASASVVIAELNTSFTASAGCPPIAEASIDLLIESDRRLFELPIPEIEPVAERIGKHVASLIEDGDCLQTGIGAIPAAILRELTNKNDLGMHGGLIDDGGMALIKSGVLTGANKPIDRHAHITGMALGSHALIEWLGETPEVLFRSANYTHEVAMIRQLPGFVSVNSAVEVDLYGQINAEVAGGRQISGTGGSVDFMRAAKASRGGRSIIAMTATARNGEVSRIVSKVELVTALRTDVDIVVTEYGIAHLKNLPSRARARALIDIAAPKFRSELETEQGS